MRDTNLKWYFAKCDCIAGRGENDSQRELFPGEVYQTLIRESIQNSIDHPNPDSDKPVRVEYTIRRYPTGDFSNLSGLREHIQKCCDESGGADRFTSMLRALNNPEMCILDVADYNTIGMDYDIPTDKGRFKQFVRYTGDPNKNKGAGGSHGYGKITYFNISEISTIVVSSMTPDGQCTFEGASRLATHETGVVRELYADTGFLDRGNGVPMQENFENQHDIIEEFRRKVPGTTVSILFADINDTNIDKVFKICCEAVLRNFFAAIQDRSLEVKVDFGFGYEQEFTGANIEAIFQDLYFLSPVDDTRSGYFDRFNPHPFWLAYKNNDVTITEDVPNEEAVDMCSEKKYICFKKELPIIGHSALYINVEPKTSVDMVVFMRCPRMVVAEMHNRSSKGYSAVFLCDDDRENKGNYLLRLMEDAAHRTWSKKQLKFDKRPETMINQAGRIEDEMRTFIRECLDIVFPSNQADSDDVELDDFTIPLNSDELATNPLLGNLIGIPGDNENIKGAPVDVHAGQMGTKKKSLYVGKAQVVDKKRVKKTDNQSETTGGHKTNHPVTPKPHTPSSGNEHFEEDQNSKERVVREKFTVKYRIFSDVDKDGLVQYTLIVHSPITEDKTFITLTPVGESEDNSCNVNIKTSSIGKVRDNEISNVPLVEGKNVITFTVDNEGEYAFSLIAEHDVTYKE